MTEGEFESLKALHAVSPVFTPEVYAWGRYEKLEPETYFLLAEFRDVGEQPPDPVTFTARLAELHRNSVSPTGKFGFHATTCHAKLTQITDCWEDSWAVLYQKQLGHMAKMDLEKNEVTPGFKVVCDLTLEKVIPRLLEPLQSEGRSIKPCLIHGDLWDENTATDMNTGEPFVFDAGSMYGRTGCFLRENYQLLTTFQPTMNMKSGTGEPRVIDLVTKSTYETTNVISPFLSPKPSGTHATYFIPYATTWPQSSISQNAIYVRGKYLEARAEDIIVDAKQRVSGNEGALQNIFSTGAA